MLYVACQQARTASITCADGAFVRRGHTNGLQNKQGVSTGRPPNLRTAFGRVRCNISETVNRSVVQEGAAGSENQGKRR
jgi:hypothetical protein